VSTESVTRARSKFERRHKDQTDTHCAAAAQPALSRRLQLSSDQTVLKPCLDHGVLDNYLGLHVWTLVVAARQLSLILETGTVMRTTVILR